MRVKTEWNGWMAKANLLLNGTNESAFTGWLPALSYSAAALTPIVAGIA